MQTNKLSKLPEIVKDSENEILDEWMKLQLAAIGSKAEFVNEATLRKTSKDFLTAFSEASVTGLETDSKSWKPVKQILAELSSSRALQGFTPSETAIFVFSLKQPIFDRLRKGIKNAEELADEVWSSTVLLDKLGLFTTEVYQKSREDVIKRQQKELLELSSPVIQLWEQVLAIPIIGTLDSQRTQTIMEALLTQIVETKSKIAILDITGVPTVDTQTAQHLIKTVAATRLMGADCLISGIRPQIAQTIIHLGIDITDVTTTATMADAVVEALIRLGYFTDSDA